MNDSENVRRSMFIDTAEIARRKELGARIHRAMVAKDWRQSDLSRATDLSRESISSYINGKTWPHDTSIKKIATEPGIGVSTVQRVVHGTTP